MLSDAFNKCILKYETCFSEKSEKLSQSMDAIMYQKTMRQTIKECLDFLSHRPEAEFTYKAGKLSQSDYNMFKEKEESVFVFIDSLIY